MRFINKYAVRDSEEPIAGTETASVTPSSGERGKGITLSSMSSVHHVQLLRKDFCIKYW